MHGNEAALRLKRGRVPSRQRRPPETLEATLGAAGAAAWFGDISCVGAERPDGTAPDLSCRTRWDQRDSERE
jgi:hypothetical protein